MKTYWDTSALVLAICGDAAAEKAFAQPGKVTRPHTLAEAFSTLTGGKLPHTLTAADASKVLKERAGRMEFVELNEADTLKALAEAKGRGVRGGLIHDFLHAVAAERAGAGKILTANLKHFRPITSMRVEAP